MFATRREENIINNKDEYSRWLLPYLDIKEPKRQEAKKPEKEEEFDLFEMISDKVDLRKKK